MWRKYWLLGSLLLFALAGMWLTAHYLAERNTRSVSDTEKSTDLAKDLRLMWETEPLRGTPDSSHGENPRASSDRAINAASRVFNTVELVGKTREEVVALLGDPRSSNDSIYNFPFFPINKKSLLYRFDCGSYGWQFELPFGGDGRVREVIRKWIR